MEKKVKWVRLVLVAEMENLELLGTLDHLAYLEHLAGLTLAGALLLKWLEGLTRKQEVLRWVSCKDQWAPWDLVDPQDPQVFPVPKVSKGLLEKLVNLVLLVPWVPVVLLDLLANLAMMVRLEKLENPETVDLQDHRVLAVSQEPQVFQVSKVTGGTLVLMEQRARLVPQVQRVNLVLQERMELQVPWVHVVFPVRGGVPDHLVQLELVVMMVFLVQLVLPVQLVLLVLPVSQVLQVLRVKLVQLVLVALRVPRVQEESQNPRIARSRWSSRQPWY